MRDRLWLGLICVAMPLASLVVSADENAPGYTDTATVRISFTVPERIHAAARFTGNAEKNRRETSSACLTARGSSAFVVNALIQNGVDWQLAPVSIRQGQATDDCDDDTSLRLDLNANWYAANGMMTLLVSPL